MTLPARFCDLTERQWINSDGDRWQSHNALCISDQWRCVSGLHFDQRDSGKRRRNMERIHQRACVGLPGDQQLSRCGWRCVFRHTYKLHVDSQLRWLRRVEVEPRRIRPLRLALLAPKKTRPILKGPSDNLQALTTNRALSDLKFVLHSAATPNAKVND